MVWCTVHSASPARREEEKEERWKGEKNEEGRSYYHGELEKTLYTRQKNHFADQAAEKDENALHKHGTTKAPSQISDLRRRSFATHPCTLGEEVHLEKNIFENHFSKYQKITKNVLTEEKKFHNFSTKNYQHFLGANFLLQNWHPKIQKKR